MHRPLLALPLLVGLAAPAGAGELLLGFEGRGEYDDNVFREDRNEDDDFILRGGPTVGLRSDREDLEFKILYRPEYEGFFDIDGISGFNHFLNLDGTWHWTDATEITFQERFARTRGVSEFGDDIPGVETDRTRSRLWRNVAELNVQHQFSERWLGDASFGHTMREFSNENNSDSETISAQASLGHLVTKRDQVGLGVSAIDQDFEDNDRTGSEGENTTFLQGFASWTHRFQPTWSFSLQAGPTWIDSDQADDDVTVFGSARMEKIWKTLTASLEYDRTASTVSGINASTERDAVVGKLEWEPSPLWVYSLTASWNRRVSLDSDVCSGVFVDSDGNLVAGTGFGQCKDFSNLVAGTDDEFRRAIDIRSYLLRARVDRRIGRRTTLFGIITYQDQDDEGKIRTANEFDDIRIMIGFRYDWKPINF